VLNLNLFYFSLPACYFLLQNLGSEYFSAGFGDHICLTIDCLSVGVGSFSGVYFASHLVNRGRQQSSPSHAERGSSENFNMLGLSSLLGLGFGFGSMAMICNLRASALIPLVMAQALNLYAAHRSANSRISPMYLFRCEMKFSFVIMFLAMIVLIQLVSFQNYQSSMRKQLEEYNRISLSERRE